MTDAANSGEQKKSSPVPWILGGCGCLLAGIGVVILGIFFVVMKATEEPEKVVTEFLSASTAGDADRAYACFDPDLQQVQSLDEFRAILSANPQLFDVDVAAVNYTKRGGGERYGDLRGNGAGAGRRGAPDQLHASADRKRLEDACVEHRDPAFVVRQLSSGIARRRR